MTAASFRLPTFLGILIVLSLVASVPSLAMSGTLSIGSAWVIIGLWSVPAFFLDTDPSDVRSKQWRDRLLGTGFVILLFVAAKTSEAAVGVTAAIASVAILGFIVASRSEYSERTKQYRLVLSIAAGCAIALWIVSVAHRWYVLPLVAAEMIATYSLVQTNSVRDRIGIALAVFLAWILTVGYPYTALSNFLFNATPSEGLALVAFAGAFILVNAAVVLPLPNLRRAPPVMLGLIAALIIFLFLGLRIDGTQSTWIPYHQSYFIGPAALVRAGHWLLWDVPSQYGFGSVLAIASFFGKTTYDKFFFLTDVIVATEAGMLFLLTWWGRRDLLGFAFALILSASVFYSSQGQYHYFGATLYPQQGFRVLWPMACMFFSYAAYRWREYPGRRRAMVFLGYASWLVGCLWSAEVGVWSTLPWGGWALAVIVIAAIKRGARSAIDAGVRVLVPFVALLVAAASVIVSVYSVRLHHAPDLRSVLEFVAIYGGASRSNVPFNPLGGMWLLLLSLGAAGSALVYIARRNGIESLSATLPSWLGLWGLCLYFVGETYENHVASIVPVLASAAMVMWCASGKERNTEWLSMRLAFIPIFVLIIAYNVGTLSYLQAARFASPVSLSAYSQTLPPIDGELAAIERKANIGPSDRVVYPDSPNWAKLSTGETLPLDRDADGRIFERFSWLPLSPAGMDNTMLTLSLERQGEYLGRALDVGPGSGWLITYLRDPDCRQISAILHATKTVTTAHYRAAFCKRGADGTDRQRNRWRNAGNEDRGPLPGHPNTGELWVGEPVKSNQSRLSGGKRWISTPGKCRVDKARGPSHRKDAAPIERCSKNVTGPSQ